MVTSASTVIHKVKVRLLIIEKLLSFGNAFRYDRLFVFKPTIGD
ncbi:hypothetical protein ACFLSZ_04695 [Candidatus Bipolaricaulota bacterium]